MDNELYKNPIDLKSSLESFLYSDDQVIIFVPFIRTRVLRELVVKSRITSIVVRWNPKDLIEGSSDLELLEYCTENKITLYRNPKLHLKAFIKDSKSAFIGSMNISQRAISDDTSLYNYELGTIVDELTLDDKIFFQRIIHESELIDKQKFALISEQVEELRHLKKEYPQGFDFTSIEDSKVGYGGGSHSHFLISALPMSQNPIHLSDLYFGRAAMDEIEEQCYIHDLANYNIVLGLSENQFWAKLKDAFINHPFIKAFNEYLEKEKSLGFSEVSMWFAENTTTVPTPRRWELKENTRILYDWIQHLSESKYKWDQPNFRQRLFWYEYYHSEILPEYARRFRNLNVAKIEGQEAINKPALLLSIIDAFDHNELDGRIILNEFVQKQFKMYWEEYSTVQSIPNCILPFYHLQSEGFWEIIYKHDIEEEKQIKSWNRYHDLVKYARLNNDLYALMVVKEFRDKLQETLIDTYFK